MIEDRAPATTARARAERSLARIAALDGRLRSCIVVRAAAVEEAAEVDARGQSGPLAGWTIGVKDNTDVRGTVRSDGLGPPSPPPASSDATAVARLRSAGAVVVAKTNLEQLSFGATTQNLTFGACRNPWDTHRIPGGSSGGSAVAVAAGLVDVALGTDTGGSLRNPAAFCGVSALRPTHGLVPVAGVTPLSPSMDVVGPMARSVEQLAPVLAALGGRAIPETAGWAEATIGVPRDYFVDDLDRDVARSFDALLDLLTGSGARLKAVALAGAAGVPEPMSVVQNAEAAQSLRAYWDDERLTPGIRHRLEMGRQVGPAELSAAKAAVATWCRTVETALTEVDVVITPTTPFVAPVADAEEGDLVAVSRRINRFTGCWSPTGTPVLALPLPRSAAGLPVGGQLVAARGRDARLLALGRDLQRETDWHAGVPVIAD